MLLYTRVQSKPFSTDFCNWYLNFIINYEVNKQCETLKISHGIEFNVL
jgi:hypothetical protein